MTKLGNSLTTYKKITTPTPATATNVSETANKTATQKTVNTNNVENPFENKKTTEQRKETKRNINFDTLYAKYKKNPSAVLKELGLPADSEELKAILKDDNALKVLLTIAEKENLTAGDLKAAFLNVMNEKPSNLLKRAWSWLTNGFRSEREVNADRLSTNMNDIRRVRGEEFSTEIVIEISIYAGDDENRKANAMHFVEKQSEKDKFLYSEGNVRSAIKFMDENPEMADQFVINTTELESIKDVKGAPRYNGDTNISVGARMTKHADLAQTMKKAAHKSDMTNEYLENITNNLAQNPYMQGAIEFSLDAKKADGTDRFSACSINTESNQLVNQNEEFCNNYENNLRKISQYENLTSEEIVSISESITKKPEIANEIISKIESGKMTGKEIAEYAENIANGKNIKVETLNNEQNETTTATITNETITAKSNNKQTTQQTETQKQQAERNFNNKTNTTQNIENNKLKEEETTDNNNNKSIVIAGVAYNAEELTRAFKTQFGSLSDEVLTAVQKDPKILDIIKQYANNPVIIKAYLDDNSFFAKIKTTTQLSKSELEDVLSLCTDESSKELMLAALEQGSTGYALKTVRYAKITNSKDDAHEILSSKTMGAELKKNKLNELYGMETRNEFCA